VRWNIAPTIRVKEQARRPATTAAPTGHAKRTGVKADTPEEEDLAANRASAFDAAMGAGAAAG